MLKKDKVEVKEEVKEKADHCLNCGGKECPDEIGGVCPICKGKKVV